MGKTEYFGNQFRERLIAERTRRGWTQSELVALLKQRGVPCYVTTVHKLESGDRAVRVDELSALADIFGISVDALIGRKSSGGDLMWAVSKLTSMAHKAITDVSIIGNRLTGEIKDVHHYAQFDNHPVDVLIDTAAAAAHALEDARKALRELADQFPMGSRDG